MSIKFHCEHCGKKIDAPDSAGGKRGKCPACHNKVYVPKIEADDDELKLAPLNETEAEQQKRLLAETFQLTQNILQEKNVPETSLAPHPAPALSEEELTGVIVYYLRQMADGELDDAQRTAETIATHRAAARGLLDQMARNDPPDPDLQDIPTQVLAGLIRNLRSRIS